jgi:hypothetical protein
MTAVNLPDRGQEQLRPAALLCALWGTVSALVMMLTVFAWLFVDESLGLVATFPFIVVLLGLVSAAVSPLSLFVSRTARATSLILIAVLGVASLVIDICRICCPWSGGGL